MTPTAQLVIGAAAAGAIAIIAHRARALSTSGALATFALGSVVFGLGGLAASVPLLTFFVFASALSRLGRSAHRDRVEESFEKGDRRDAGQVFANGGIAGIIVVIGTIGAMPEWYIAYLGALAAAAADTWGTEVGILGRGRVISITTFSTVEPGRSGGISLLGTLGAVTGSALVAASGACWTNDTVRTVAIATAAGTAGMLVDSIVGATVQARYRCSVCGRITERRVHCDVATDRVGGFAWIGNDAVNVACTVAGALFAIALMHVTR